ncbi:phosphatase PAP2 family protein [Ectothiorhodospiraceae bacterium WFHF3C12]|nr:phosphatase PAP2 family protein [Ectothiorhodospiraceae bacterium WFHF3C12]
MDQAILLWINQGWAHWLLDPFFIWVSAKWTFSFPLLAIFLATWWYQYGRDGAWFWLAMAVSVGLGDAFGNQLKDAFDQYRPCFELVELTRWPGHAPGDTCTSSTSGLPSNHALNFFVAAAFVTAVLRSYRWGVGLFALAVVVSISRVYLSKHYPSQVLVGGLIGTGWGLLCAYLALRHFPAIQRLCPAMAAEDGPDVGEAPKP